MHNKAKIPNIVTTYHTIIIVMNFEFYYDFWSDVWIIME
jgi:hypothetical protein